MVANTNPIFVDTPNVAPATFNVLTAANTATDGTGTVATIYTAGADGGRIERIRYKALGTNTQTVLRLFINNGSTNTTAANNNLIHEETIASTTASATTALTNGVITFTDGIVLPAGYKINATIGTAVAAGLAVTAFGGDY